MKFDIIAAGYPSIDHILPVNRAPKPGETGVILEPPCLDAFNLGGCAPNIAVAGARMGLKTTVVILVGSDTDGQYMINTLNQEGVDTQFGVYIVPNGHTAHSFLFVDPQNRHQTFYFPGVSDCEEVEIRLGEHTPAEAYWGVITVGNARHNRSALDWMVKNGVSILWSHKNDSCAFPDDLIIHLAEVSEIVVLNRHEAKAVQQSLGMGDISEMLELGPRAVILTEGAQGSQIITTTGTMKVTSVSPHETVDPTGAGDAFTAGVLFGLRNNLSLKVCCQIGAIVASFVLEAWGCQTNLPTLPDMRARYHQYFGNFEL